MSQEQHLQEFQYIDLRRQTDFLLRNSDEYKVFLEMQKQLYSLKSKSKIKSERLEFLKRASQSNGGPNEQELNEIKNISIQLVLSQQEIQNQQDLLSAQNKKLQLKSNSIIATLKKNMNSNATQEAVQNQPQSDNNVIQNDNSGVTQNDNSGVIDLTEDNE
ncbi:unnamed protein product [[Candida] boidinii]|nr:unnamed protein product [[Candida] boidinii]